MNTSLNEANKQEIVELASQAEMLIQQSSKGLEKVLVSLREQVKVSPPTLPVTKSLT